MNAYEVLQDHHRTLKGLCEKITGTPADSRERAELFDGFLVELDIHFRIEDDIYYPALAAASTLLAIARAEHRQVMDQLAVVLRTSPTAPEYDDEWRSFTTVLTAHADKEERDMIPAPLPVQITDDEVNDLGRQMTERIERLRNSALTRLRVKARATLLRAM